MKVADYSLSSFKFLSINLLLLEHLFLIFGSLIFQQLFSFLNHIVNIFGFFVHCPPVINLWWLKFVLIIVHQSINFAVLFYLHSHLFNLC